MTKADSNTDTRTLEGARYVLTVKNKDNPLYDKGSFAVGAEVVCLRKSASGYYVPCVAFIVNSMPQSHAGRVTVDLYEDRSERVTVSVKAILWKTPPTTKQSLHEKVCQQCGRRFPTRDDTRLICNPCEAARLALPPMKIPAVTVIADTITRWKFEPLPDGKQGFAVFEGNLLVAVVGECASRPEYALDLVKMVTAAPELYHAAMSALAYLQGRDIGDQGKAVVAKLTNSLTIAAE